MIEITPDYAARDISESRYPCTGLLCEDWRCSVCPTKKVAEMVYEVKEKGGN